MVQKSSVMSLLFTSPDERAVVQVGSQVDFSYTLSNGGRAVVSLPLTAIAALAELFPAIAADEDVQALIPALEPEEPGDPGEPEP